MLSAKWQGEKHGNGGGNLGARSVRRVNARTDLYVNCRKSFRNLLKEKRQKYKANKLKVLTSKMKDSKMFWSEVRSICVGTCRQPLISTNEWFTHFKNVLGGDTNQDKGEEDYADPPGIEGLDSPISEEEVKNAIGQLKLNKSPGPDGILAEMLKNSLEHILSPLVLLFNHVFDTGQYPSAWSGAIIVPIHKSGDKDDPDNYRGVSLLSILGKVFAHILNKRLTLWADENDKIVEEQSGFRAGHSTVDNMFVLYAIVQRYLLKKSGKVYICFVDFKKAFDTINRNVLWNVLRKSGVGGKMLRILQSMYRSVRSCVRCPDNLTEFFECPTGVRQGGVLSPTLFSFLINELALEIAQNGMYGVQLTPDVVQILVMLFADDVLFASYCVAGLQRQIDILKHFADNFSMTVNMSKTKIIVFRKGGFLAANEVWRYGDEEIEVVNSYKYLGLYFTTKLSLTQAVGDLAAKAKIRTSQILKCLWRLGNVPRNVFFKMYDAQILPILMYGSELWGFQQFAVIKKAHMFACKRFLNVSVQTPNKMIYGDLGRYPIFITSAVRCVKYWLRITNLPDERLPKKAYNMLLYLQDLGKKTWAYHVKELLCRNSFGDVWLQQNVGHLNRFVSVFKQRLLDQFQQDWSASITSKERFEFYSIFKQSIQTEKYIDILQLRCFREAYIKFRFGISPILVHRLRYRNDIIPRDLLCPVCKDEIEDESHVLFSCKAYEDFRKDVSWFNGSHTAVVVDVSHVMSADNERSIWEVSRFLYKVLQRRNDIVTSQTDA